MNGIQKMVVQINNHKEIFLVKLGSFKEKIYTLSSSSGEDISQLLTVNKTDGGITSTTFSVLHELRVEDQLVYAYVKEFDIVQRYLIGELIELGSVEN